MSHTSPEVVWKTLTLETISAVVESDMLAPR